MTIYSMLSGVILTKNNKRTIDRCLVSLLFCDEIIIIDDYSTDGSIEKISPGKIKVWQRKLNDDFASSRNFGLDKAKGDWILFVDSDEVVEENLKKEILAALNNSSVDGYFIKRLDFFLGKKLIHGETAHVSLLRLGRKGKGTWERKVHEKWDMKGETGQLINPLWHYPHPTIREFLGDINRYSTLHAEQLLKEGQKASSLSIVIKPLGKFFHNYFVLGSILDGVPGLVITLMMSFHSFLSQSKLWQLQQQKRI